jgi:outer membrane protein TolC
MRVCVLLLMAAGVPLAFAQQIVLAPPNRPAQAPAAAPQDLNLEDLIAEALQHNPELRAAQKRAEALRARPRQEGALADPTLSVGYSSSGAPLPGWGIGREPTSNVGFSVTQDLAYPGKRRLMAGVASKEADAEVQQFQIAERAVIARVKRAYHRLYHADEAVEVMRNSRDSIGQLIQLAEIRYSTGKAAQQDVFKAQTQAAIMETRILKMQQDAAMARAEINALLGRALSTPLGKPAHRDPRELKVTVDELTAAAGGSSPILSREQKLAEARQMAVSLARKNFNPDFAVSGGYYYMGTMPDMYQFRLDIKLPNKDRRRAALTEQVQNLEQARSSYQAADQDTRWRVNELFLIAQTSWRLIQIYQDTVMPQSDLSVEAALASYSTGSLDSMTVLMTVMTRIEQDERYHEEMLNYFQAIIGLEELTGLELL